MTLIRKGIKMIEIRIVNKIEEKINEFIKRTGTTKVFISKKLGISRQRLHDLSKADNFYLDTLIKLSILLECDVKDLYEYEIISK